MRAALSLAVACALLAGCGGDNTNTNPGPTDPVDYSKLERTPNNDARLVQVSEKQLAEYLKNGMRLQLTQGYAWLETGVPAPTADAAAGGGAGRSFSETNVHVAGVDEADYAKYDGKHWFVATYPRYDLDQAEAKPGFQVVATDPAAPDADIISSFTFDDDWGDVGSLYLVQDGETTSHVAAVRNQWGNVYPILPGPAIGLAVARPGVVGDALIWPGPRNSKVQVQLVDVTTPASPKQDWEIELDGSLIDSRKIGDTLYLVTRYDPWITTLKYETDSKDARTANETALEDVDTDDLVPHYRIGGAEYPLTRVCFVQDGLKENQGLASLVHITAVDLAGQKVIGSTCLNSAVENLSMSPGSLYLTGTIYNFTNSQHNTVVHKFSLAEAGPKYEATGSVKGGLNRTTDPQFRMHEHEDEFRIVTSTWTNTGPEHKLTILGQNGSALTAVGELPNSADPTPIGKPGEDIYAVRFVDDRAYLVTFQRTDPLYTLDLSDHSRPKVIGALEIPGFATYMHPVGDGLLFTLGHSADETGRANGIKADLFDVSGNQARMLNSVKLSDANGYSEALNNLRALSLLPRGEDELRIALPLTRYSSSTWVSTGLQLLQINGITGGAAVLKDAGIIVAEGPGFGARYPGSGVDRGILHDNAVFYTHNNAIWAAHWDKPREAKGPILGDPIACTLEARPSLEVHVYSDELGSTEDECLSTFVTAMLGETRFDLDLVPEATPAPVPPTADLIPAPPVARRCVFSGPHEVGGYFDVHVVRRGWTRETINQIFVPKGVCHVQTQRVEVKLRLLQ